MTKITVEEFLKILEEKSIEILGQTKTELKEWASEVEHSTEGFPTVLEMCLEHINLRRIKRFETEVPSLGGSKNEAFGGKNYKNSEIFAFAQNGWFGTFNVRYKTFILTRANHY